MDIDQLINDALSSGVESVPVEGLGRLTIANLAKRAGLFRRRGVRPPARLVRALRVAAKSCAPGKSRQRTLIGDTLFCRRNLAASALAKDAKLDVFHVGPGEAASKLGYAAGEIDEVHTNMGEEGRLPTDESFAVYGIGVDVRTTSEADYRAITDNLRFQWRQSDNTVLRLPRLQYLPPERPLTRLFRGNTDGTLVQQTGKVFVQPAPLFTISGREKVGDKAKGQLVVLRGFTPSAAVELVIELYGSSTQNV